MPADLLDELEAMSSSVGALEGIEGIAREALRREAEVCSAVEGLQGSARLFERAWQRVVMDVAKGRTCDMQAVRTRFVNTFDKRLSQVKQTHASANLLRQLGSQRVPDPGVLLPEIAGMERLKARVFDLWQTAEDLEDLAARDYPLSTADLDKIGPQHRPPASFYADESKPF